MNLIGAHIIRHFDSILTSNSNNNVYQEQHIDRNKVIHYNEMVYFEEQPFLYNYLVLSIVLMISFIYLLFLLVFICRILPFSSIPISMEWFSETSSVSYYSIGIFQFQQQQQQQQLLFKNKLHRFYLKRILLLLTFLNSQTFNERSNLNATVEIINRKPLLPSSFSH